MNTEESLKCPLCGKSGKLNVKLIHSQKDYTAVWCFCKHTISTIGVDPRPRKIDMPLEVWDGTEAEADRLGLRYISDGDAVRWYYPGDYIDSGEMWCGGVEDAERLGLYNMNGLAAWCDILKGDQTQVGKTGITRLA